MIATGGMPIYEELRTSATSAGAFASSSAEQRIEAVAWTWLHKRLIGLGLTQDEAKEMRRRYRARGSTMHEAITACLNDAIELHDVDLDD